MLKIKTASAVLSVFVIQCFSVVAFAASEGDLEGRVLRSRDSQPVVGVAVQILETGAKTSTNAQGGYSFDLPPGLYTMVVTPLNGTPIQRKITVGAGKTTREDVTVGSEMSALEQITVLAHFHGFRFELQVYRALGCLFQCEKPDKYTA